MKRIKFIAALLMASAFLFPMWGSSSSSSDKEEQKPNPGTIPIVLHNKKTPIKRAPSRGLDAYIIFDDGGISFILPFDTYPVYVEVIGEETTSGYWSSTLTDDTDTMSFDGEAGDYRLEISTSDASYIGFFTL